MPALSPTMDQGKLARWLVKEGDKVTSGKVIAEIETDKATMEVEAVDEGTVGKILVPAGAEGVAVNTPIALLLEEGEDAAGLSQAAREPAANPAPAPAAKVEPAAPAASPQAGAAAPAVNGHAGGRVFASPLARRLAKEGGLELTVLKGSGPHGRIVAADVKTALANPPQPAAPPPSKGQSLVIAPPQAVSLPQAMTDEQIMALYEPGSYELVPHDNMRRTIATRLVQAKSTIPHFYLSVDCELDSLLAARQRLNAASPKDGPGAFKLSVNDFIIKALALALQRVPEANAVWTERGVLRHKRSDVAVAVAVEGGLFTPVLRGAEAKTLGQLSNEMKDLAARARKRRLAPHEYQGGVTAVSNLGMFGIKSFDAVINPPHSTILAVGEGQERAVARHGAIVAATVMSVTLSCDHRVVDGALGAALLAAFKGFIEEPVTMLV